MNQRHCRFVMPCLLSSFVALTACSDDETQGSTPNAVTPDFGGLGFEPQPGDGVTNAVLQGQVENFSGEIIDPAASGINTTFAECAGVVQRAEAISRPTDIIFVIDNSSSMDGEIRQVQARINEDFAEIIQNSGVDYRVIMISRYGDIDVDVGDSDNPICIGGNLGGQDCSNPEATPLQHNPPRFYHYSTDVRSREVWCRVLEGYSTPDELTTDTVRASWPSIAPNGWSEFLRPEAFKTFVTITDDDSHCGPQVEADNRAPFRDVNGQPFTYNFDDGNSAQQGMQAAQQFDAALLALSPQQFGTAESRNYDWYSIVGMAENDPADAVWTPDQPVQEGTCGTNAESEGAATGFQALSVMTGALRYPSCRNDDFNAVFRAIAGGVVAGALTCEWDIPEIDGGFDAAQVNLIFTPSEGNQKLGQYVENEGACVAGGWYLDDRNNPQRVIACPETCNVLKGDVGGQVNLLFGCATVSDLR